VSDQRLVVYDRERARAAYEKLYTAGADGLPDDDRAQLRVLLHEDDLSQYRAASPRTPELDAFLTTHGNKNVSFQTACDMVLSAWEMSGLMLRQLRFQVTDRLVDLERRVDELSARPASLDYQGVWDREQTYQSGQAVTDHGSLWLCTTNQVRSRPAEDAICWRLICKKGRDGRDGRDAR
jgi:hypothetical protein